jgi:hypothetical protein
VTDSDPETELAPTVSTPEAKLAWSAGDDVPELLDEDETELLDEDGDRERTTLAVLWFVHIDHKRPVTALSAPPVASSPDDRVVPLAPPPAPTPTPLPLDKNGIPELPFHPTEAQQQEVIVALARHWHSVPPDLPAECDCR